MRVADGEDAATLEGSVFNSVGSVSGDVMRSGSPVMLDDAAEDERVDQPLVRLGNIRAAIFVPLAVRERTFGTLSVGNHEMDPTFSRADVEIVSAFAAQAAVALEHARMTGELQRLALVEDRERIAKELHDDVIQSLFAEGMALQASLGMLADQDAMGARITQAVENIDRVIRDLRNYIFGLRPGAAADRQLDQSLRDLAASFEGANGMSIEVTTDPDPVSRMAGRSADIVQAAREAISNAVRHSGGERRTGASREHDEGVALEIEDNGDGFDRSKSSGHGTRPGEPARASRGARRNPVDRLRGRSRYAGSHNDPELKDRGCPRPRTPSA